MTFLILWYMVPFWGDSIKEAIGNWQVEVTFGKSQMQFRMIHTVTLLSVQLLFYGSYYLKQADAQQIAHEDSNSK